MSHAPKNNPLNPKLLRARAELLATIRQFFAERSVLEVETPLLAASTIPDPHIHSLTCQLRHETYYLQTSPEFSMKKLLANGSGSIYQICKAFRTDEQGKLHNPEFTMLEWYRLDFNHWQLMAEIEQLLQCIMPGTKTEQISYQEVFLQYLNIDPLIGDTERLINCALANGLNMIENLDHDAWLNLLYVNFIEPNLGKTCPTFIYNFPASQAALAKIKGNIAERFELYINGIELANGFHELTDANEQRQRFQHDLKQRELLGLPPTPIDEDFLMAVDQLPNCAGVALGLDRLLMVLTGTQTIHELINI